jgi:hypothetical protein
MTAKRYAFGDRVRSAAVKGRGEFVGTVTFVGHSYYHVRDDDGDYWHRDASELSPVIRENAA